jgi:Starch-binding associating with outer membrane
MCFNIAEGLNRGWASGTAATWYNNGINSSLSMYKITDGQTLTISDIAGKTIGTTTVNLPAFLANVVYAGNNAAGLTQILQQKYVSMCQNSGMEAYYNFRRTGVPAFAQGGPGIGTGNSLIPMRWIYPNDQIVANSSNYQAAIQAQGFGKDDPNAVMWLLK